MVSIHDGDAIRTAVQDRYAQAAQAAEAGLGSNVSCGTGFGSQLYAPTDVEVLPTMAVAASLGCGNPTALAELRPGQVVLDLGSGGGIDVLLSARRVGPTGRAYGLDMTPQMLELARRNQAEAQVSNAEFLLGTLEEIPLPDNSVDVIISNCVINLAADKDVVLAEAHRVLKPGGLFAVSDVVLKRQLPQQVSELIAAWTGCVAGALTQTEYFTKLATAGFVDAEIVPTLIHDRAGLAALASGLELPADLDQEKTLDELDGAIMNAFVRARADG